MFARADLFVLPSVSEPFGLAPLEALQAGVPVIVSDQGGPKEVVDDGITGVVLPGDKPDAWTASVGDLLIDDERRERVVRAKRRDHGRQLDRLGARPKQHEHGLHA